MIPDTTPAIELRGVTVREGDDVCLDSIDLTVRRGQACGIAGSNGSGKSVLLRVVAGLCRPSAGQVRVGGIDALARPDRVRGLIGYVPDEPGLADRLTAREHLDLAASLRGLSRADRQAAAESMLELVDLAPHARHPVGSLSRGQRHRLAVALALVHDPPILILDEPVARVDDVGRGELISVLLELRSMGKTLLLSSPSPTDLADVCDVVAPLVAGRLVRATQHEPINLTWIEVVGDVEPALRTLREHPGVDDVRQEGAFVTFKGPASAEERSRFVEWLVGCGVHLSGFGTTVTPAGGGHE